MPANNPFQKANRGKKFVKLLISGGSGGGKTLTAIQIACHMAAALGRPGSVAVVDTEDGSASLYSFDQVVGEPYLCNCEQCSMSNRRMPLEFDHLDLRDHSPQEFNRNMLAAATNGYAVLVADSASHEWCGVNGCLEQVDALKGDGKGRATDNAWNKVGALHNEFLRMIRSIEIHLIATARTKPDRGDGGEIIVQRDKDGPFYYEFGFWGTLTRQQPGTLHIAKSRSGHFQGEVWKKSGKHVANQLLLWAGHLSLPDPRPVAEAKTPPQELQRPQGRTEPVGDGASSNTGDGAVADVPAQPSRPSEELAAAQGAVIRVSKLLQGDRLQLFREHAAACWNDPERLDALVAQAEETLRGSAQPSLPGPVTPGGAA